MKEDLKKVKEWLENFEDVIEINILEYNKYLVVEKAVFKKEEFIQALSKKNFELEGLGSREFYIEMTDSFTIQVSNFEYETELGIS